MININKFITFIGIFAVLTFVTSCEIDPDLNIDPNNPTDVSVDLLLPSAQVGTFFVYGDDNARMVSLWMQQHSGTDRQYIPLDRYSVTSADVNSAWSRAYADCMIDIKTVIDKAEAEGDLHYAGIAKIMMAMTLGVITDLWGSVPYTNAFQGKDGVTKPTYDTQEAVYTEIQALLAAGKADIAGESSKSPGADDIIFGGDLGLWDKCANVLSARYHLHLSKRSGDAYANALAAIDAGAFAGTAENAQGLFDASQVNGNFWYLFNAVERPGYMSAGAHCVNMMNDAGDPRIASYYTLDAAGGYSGSVAGAAEQEKSTTGPSFASINSPIPLVTFEEQKFIEAEAALQTGDAERAAMAYNEAVTASIALHGGADSTFTANTANEDAGSITLEKIMTQKYLALFTQIEVFNDWRRTGIPSLSLAESASETEIPRRLVYPLDEIQLNNDNTPGAALTDRVWWDQ